MATASLQEKNGKYHIVINTRESGVRKQKWISTKLDIKGNKKQAEKMMRDILAEIEENGGVYVKPKIKNDINFSEYLQIWFDERKEELQTTTNDSYQHMLDKHIKPYFEKEKISLGGLSSEQLEAYYDFKISEGLGKNTILKHHALIRTALKDAVLNKFITENIASSTKRPKKKKFTAGFYNIEELNKLFSVIKGDKLEIVILLTVYYGLRRSEALGMRWSNIDFINNRIPVKHKVVRTKDDEGRMTVSKEDGTKTDASERTMPLHKDLVEYLNRLKTIQAENKAKYKEKYRDEDSDYICVDKYGKIFNPDEVTHHFSKIIAKNGLREIRFHDLRHSCATLLLHLGYDLKFVQEWLGHANIQTTANIYSHVDMSKKSEMMDRVGNELKFL